MQVIGSYMITVVLDSHIGNRRRRGLVAIAGLGVLVIAGWTGMIFWVRHQSHGDLPLIAWDMLEPEYWPFCILNLVFGLNMAMVSLTSLESRV